MITEIRQKNSRVLSSTETIELLKLLKTHNKKYIAEKFKITINSVYYHINKNNAKSDYYIDEAIKKIERTLLKSDQYPPRNYVQQETCDHINCTLFLKCPCTLTIGENDIDRLIDILQRKKAYMEAHKPKQIAI